MKKIFSICILTALIASGCLKDKDFEDSRYGIQEKEVKGIGFPRAGFTFGVVAIPEVQVISQVVIGVNSINAPTSDLAYTLSSSPALLPAGVVAVPTANIVIPATNNFSPGQFSDTIALAIRNADQLNPNNVYGIALTVSSVGSGYIVSENTKTIIIKVNIKNKYDGVYTVVSGFVQRYSAPGVPTVGDALNGPLDGNPDVTLSTISANTVELTGLTWSGGTSGIAGIDNLRATVDPVTNLVTMFALGNASLVNWPGKENKYDPTTKTFTLNAVWNPTANRRELSLTLKYKKPR